MRLSNLRLSWNIFFVFLFVIVLCVVVVGEFALHSLHDSYLDAQKDGLRSIAQLARRDVGMTPADPALIVQQIAADAGARITIVLPDGRVVADSEENPARMENHANRSEVQAALRGRVEPAIRFSHTLNTDMLYLAVPLEQGGKVIAVVRAARPLSEIQQRETAVRLTLWRGCILGALIAALVSLYLAKRISRPIERIRRAAERYAAGDYSNRIYMTRPPEYVELAKSMNRMAREMDRRLHEITRQRNERDAILAGMREGLLAVDRDERIVLINPAAGEMLGITPADAVGHLVQETLRNPELQRFVTHALAAESNAADEILLHWPGGKMVLAASSPLKNGDGAHAGLLLVLNDVTRLRRLENLRREFVANVSHELRTPITSIKGFIETLRDGALSDPEAGPRFLEIIARQADRLNAIIEDLLALSRIEREAERHAIELFPCELKPLLEHTILQFAPQADAREMKLELECPEKLSVRANAQLLEQAVSNLIDNAIKYSQPGKSVRVAAEAGEHVSIRVIDEGVGIPAEHLPRIFERFYRVDPARSREAGGTGLGLAIVKHIVQAHGGRIDVESKPGIGSTFTIVI
ncbi:cell wall metabolism sensor histidine kinase WalK [bacterium]|nr:cell wall metabolism sensor histidine kinase WalK [bacterium]